MTIIHLRCIISPFSMLERSHSNEIGYRKQFVVKACQFSFQPFYILVENEKGYLIHDLRNGSIT